MTATQFWVANRSLNPDIALLRNRKGFCYPALQLYFNRIPKNANTYVMLRLAALNGNALLERDKIRKETKTPLDLTSAEMKIFSNYTKFVVIRNPFTRILSAFLNKIGSGHKKYSRYHGFANPSRSGFQSFLEQLNSLPKKDTDPHFWPQCDHLLLRSISSYDAILKFERLDRDLDDLFFKVGLIRDSTEALVKSFNDLDAGKATNASEKAAQYFTDTSAELTRSIFAKDFSALDYSENLPSRDDP